MIHPWNGWSCVQLDAELRSLTHCYPSVKRWCHVEIWYRSSRQMSTLQCWHLVNNSQGRQSVSNIVRVQSLSPPLPLEVGPLIYLEGLGERCKLPQWGLGQSPSRQRFRCIFRVKERCWWHSRCTVCNIKKRPFLRFYEEVFEELTSSIYRFCSVARLLWGSSKP